MRTLVTGSSGTIGTAMVLRLLAEGHQVIGLDKRPQVWEPNVAKVTKIVDLASSPDFGDLLPWVPELVINLAANARVHRLVVEPKMAMENIQVTFNVLDFARKEGVDFVLHASSREVYGENAPGTCTREDAPKVPESPYTASKMSCEALLESFRRCYRLKATVVRFSNVYGAYDDKDRLIPLFLWRASRGLPLVVYGGSKTMDFTYLDDAIAGALLAIQMRRDGQTFNIATGAPHRIADVAEVVNQVVSCFPGISPKAGTGGVVVRPNRTGEIMYYCADLTAARRLLGYFPPLRALSVRRGDGAGQDDGQEIQRRAKESRIPEAGYRILEREAVGLETERIVRELRPAAILEGSVADETVGKRHVGVPGSEWSRSPGGRRRRRR